MLQAQAHSFLLNNSKQQRTLASEMAKKIREQDRKNDIEGIREMFIGYLLHCNETEMRVSDHVYASYINITASADWDQEDIPDKLYTISEYAALKGIKSLSAQLASMLGKKAGSICSREGLKITLTGSARRYPEQALEEVFSKPITR